MIRTDDPIRDYMAYDSEQEARRDRLPVCAYCDNPIEDDHYFLINDEVICSECLESYFRRDVEDYID